MPDREKGLGAATCRKAANRANGDPSADFRMPSRGAQKATRSLISVTGNRSPPRTRAGPECFE
jgi:hypothetical protein